MPTTKWLIAWQSKQTDAHGEGNPVYDTREAAERAALELNDDIGFYATHWAVELKEDGDG